ncbi:hypothetical protein EPN96_05520 [bacterium]|nr:MAG: hypothetical protein EPN96_05520 [bacterium]
MKLEIIKKIPDCRLLWTGGGKYLAAKGNRFFFVDGEGNHLSKPGEVGATWERGLSRVRLFRHFLRLGVHHLLPLGDGAFLVIIRKRAYRVEADGAITSEFRFPRGNKPAAKGVCVTPAGDIFLAEYALNGQRTLPAMVHRSRDGGKTFETVHEFEAGLIRHYHFVQWDPYENCLWMGTGDADSECLLFRGDESGENWTNAGGGSQLWRAVGVAFRPEALYWGTDAGSDAGTHPNFVMRFDRKTRELRKVMEVQGPCHGNAALSDGTLVVTTGVEGGQNEKDRSAHLWASRDGVSWEELFSCKKDLWPHIVQFGVIRFPQGMESGEKLAFTCFGLEGRGERSLIARITDGQPV